MKKTVCLYIMVIVILVIAGCRSTKPVDIENLILSENDGFSDVSSTWGLNISLDSSKIDTNEYIIQWIIEDGYLRTWNESSKTAVEISNELDGYPCTYSDDKNGGSIIWSPKQPNEYTVIKLEVFIFSKDNTKHAIAHDSAKITKEDSSYSIMN